MIDHEWDKFVARHPHGHHEQTSRYGWLRRPFGFECDRIVVRHGSEIVGGVQVLIQKTPLGGLARIFRGPLARDEDPAVMRQVVRELEDLAGRRSYSSLRVDTFPTQETARVALANAGFCSTLAWARRKKSCLIPLDRTDDELLATMKGNVRYSVRFARKRGVVVRHGERSLIEDFYALHEMSANRQGFPVFPREYFAYLWDLYHPENRIRFFVAFHNGKPIAAAGNLLVGNVMYYSWGGLHGGAAERKLLGMYLTHMEAAAWAREQSCTHYDLSGDQKFKRQFALESISWPEPQRKFYGTLQWLHHKLFVWTARTTTRRRLIGKASRLLGVRAKNEMPW